MRNSQMQAVCVAPTGRLVPKGKLLANIVVVNLWMLMDGQVAKAVIGFSLDVAGLGLEQKRSA